MGFRFAGPECASTNRVQIDSGTLQCHQNRPPGPDPKPIQQDAVAKKAAPMDRAVFKLWALGEAWTGSFAMDSLAFLGGYKTISKASGAFLRMYLRHAVNEDAVVIAGEEIAASAEYQALQSDVQEVLQTNASNVLKRLPTAIEIVSITKEYLKKRYREEGIAFRGALNPIIGGIGGIDVVGLATVLQQSGAKSTTMVKYKFNVKFEDKYKFVGNQRSGGKAGTIADQPEYDKQRKRWATLLDQGKYGTVVVEYHEQFYLGEKSLREGTAFASLMYALESAGITPGPLPWSVTIPMAGQVGVSS